MFLFLSAAPGLRQHLGLLAAGRPLPAVRGYRTILLPRPEELLRAGPADGCAARSPTFVVAAAAAAVIMGNCVSLIFKATTRCSSSPLEPPPSASGKRSPRATTSVSSPTEPSWELCSCPDCHFHARPAIKNLRGEYYLNGHWVIEFSRATPIAGTTLYYQRGAEGDSVPESISGRGPTTEPLVVEVRSNGPQLTFAFTKYEKQRERETFPA